MRILKDFFFYGNVYVALPIMCLYFSSQIMFQNELVWNAKLEFVVGGSLALYPLHRLVSLILTRKPFQLERLKRLDSLKWFLILPIIFGGVLALYSLIRIHEINWYFLCVLILLSITYTLPLIRISGRWWRLRDIPYIKVILVSGVVASLTIYFALDVSSADLEKLGLWFFAQLFFLVGITIPFDIRDFDIDSSNGTLTFPVVFGRELAAKIAVAFIVLYELFCLFIYVLFPEMPFSFLLVLWLTGFWSTWWLKKISREKSEFFYIGAFEGALVIQFVLLLIAFKLS